MSGHHARSLPFEEQKRNYISIFSIQIKIIKAKIKTDATKHNNLHLNATY